MMFPLVGELAADGVPVTVTCRVLKLCRQQHYRWQSVPVTDGQLAEAWLANAIFDAHRDDPGSGCRFRADEVRLDDHDASDRVVWRICRDNQCWSRFGNPKRGKGSKLGAPSHGDLVRRDFTAKAPNLVWVTDLTEHRTAWIPGRRRQALLLRHPRRAPHRHGHLDRTRLPPMPTPTRPKTATAA